jgi:L-alanine-DL-glutamate epimerase-like enolase superfamily enzyme
VRPGSRDIIVSIETHPFHCSLSESFEIAGGVTHAHHGIFVSLQLADGTIGYGEAAPLTAFNGETAQSCLRSIRRAQQIWQGQDAMNWRTRLEELEEILPRGAGAARAALGTAILDAWCKKVGIPLRIFFGGASSHVLSDITVTLLEPDAAALAARRIRDFGVGTVKIKVGRDIDSDVKRIAAVAAIDPRFKILLDANQGYDARQSLALLKALKSRGLVISLFEQPAAADDWEGLVKVARDGKVAVAADESLRGRRDALELSRRRCVSVFNLKFMKMGLLEAWDCALIARAAGIGLMAGAMIEL